MLYDMRRSCGGGGPRTSGRSRARREPRAAAGRAGLGAKFRPISSMARCRFDPFSPVLDGRFIAHNTFFSSTKKRALQRSIAVVARSLFFYLQCSWLIYGFCSRTQKKRASPRGSRALQGPFFVLGTSLSSEVPGYNNASRRYKRAQTEGRSTVSRKPHAAAEWS